MKTQVLEFKRVAPFDGCFHRWEYIAMTWEGKETRPTCHPIVFTDNMLKIHEVVGHLVFHDFGLGPPSYTYDHYRDPTVYDWGQELFNEVPYGYFPEFYAAAEELGLEFPWQCAECERIITDEPPCEMAGYKGNGGIGIEPTGWICSECAYERDLEEERWYEEHKKEV